MTDHMFCQKDFLCDNDARQQVSSASDKYTYSCSCEGTDAAADECILKPFREPFRNKGQAILSMFMHCRTLSALHSCFLFPPASSNDTLMQPYPQLLLYDYQMQCSTFQGSAAVTHLNMSYAWSTCKLVLTAVCKLVVVNMSHSSKLLL